MFPQNNRVSNRGLVFAIRKKGRFFAHENFSVSLLRGQKVVSIPHIKFCISISKKVGKANERNFLRRRIISLLIPNILPIEKVLLSQIQDFPYDLFVLINFKGNIGEFSEVKKALSLILADISSHILRASEVSERKHD